MTATFSLLYGRAGTGKTHTCLAEMAARMDASPLGAPLVLLVPDQMTYQTERALAARATCGGTMRAHVYGFTRLAQTVAQTLGGRGATYLSAIGKRLLLKKIAVAEKANLTVLQNASRQRGFSASLADIVQELKTYGDTPETLRSAADAVENEHLKAKLTDIARLYDAFLRETDGKHTDAQDEMRFLADAVPRAPLFRDAEVWVDGFSFFNPQEYAVLEAILRTSARLTVTLPLDAVALAAARHAGDCDRAEAQLFYRASKTYPALRAMAARQGVTMQEHALTEVSRFQHVAGALATLEKHLFSYAPCTTRPQYTDDVHIVEAATRRLEVEGVAAEIVKICRDEGRRYQGIGILLRDMAGYRDILEHTLTDYGIAFYTDARRAGVHHPLAELLRAAAAIAQENWRYDDVFRAIKTDLVPLTADDAADTPDISDVSDLHDDVLAQASASDAETFADGLRKNRDAADRLENYVLEFNLRGESSWTRADDWQYKRKRDRMLTTEESNADRTAINRIRRAVATPFGAFCSAWRAADTVRARVQAFFDLLAALRVPETLTAWAHAAQEDGRTQDAKEHERIWRAVSDLFSQMAQISGDAPMSADDFVAVMEDGLDALEMAFIPQRLDAVTIAPFDAGRLQNMPVLFILGANEGIMPRRREDNGLFSDADRSHLRAVGLSLAAEDEERFGESYMLYRAFTSAKERLWVSYALADGEGKGTGKSPLVTRILQILGAPVDAILLENAGTRASFLYTVGTRAVGRLAPALRAYTGGAVPPWASVYNWALTHERARIEHILRGKFSPSAKETLLPSLSRKLYAPDGRLAGSVSRFESFRECPFRHFAQYGLRLEERLVQQFAAPDFGNLLHAVMAAFGVRVRDAGRAWRDITPDERHTMCQSIMEEIAPTVQNEILLSTAQYQNLGSRIARTAESALDRLIHFDGVSAFSPCAFEKRFGAFGNAPSAIHFALPDDVALDISGQIDRIDVCNEGGKRYFLVIDYKSGARKLTEEDVYYGLALQLLTYVLAAPAALRDVCVFPAGVCYCLLKNETQTTAKNAEGARQSLWKKLQMRGWFIDEPAVWDLLDATTTFIPLTRKTEKPSKKKKAEDDVPAENCELLTKYAQKLVHSEARFAMFLDYTRHMLRRTGESILAGSIEVAPFSADKRDACKFCTYRTVCGFDPKLGGFKKRAPRPGTDYVQAMREALEKEGQA